MGKKKKRETLQQQDSFGTTCGEKGFSSETILIKEPNLSKGEEKSKKELQNKFFTLKVGNQYLPSIIMSPNEYDLSY